MVVPISILTALAWLLAQPSIAVALPKVRNERDIAESHLLISDRGWINNSSNTPEPWQTSIRSIKLDGTNASRLHTFPNTNLPNTILDSSSIAYDPIHSESPSSIGDIFIGTPSGLYRLSPSNGTTKLTLIIPNTSIHSVAAHRGKIYYISGSDDRNTINRANLDGSNVEIVYEPKRHITSFTLDHDTGELYWSVNASDEPYSGTLYRATPQWTSDVDVVITYLNQPTGLRAVQGFIYWIETGSNLIRRGTFGPAGAASVMASVETVVIGREEPPFVDVDFPDRVYAITAFAVDLEYNEGKLYFTLNKDSLAKLVVTEAGGGELKVLNDKYGDLGRPSGLGFVRGV